MEDPAIELSGLGILPPLLEAIRELESTGEKNTGICTGCMVAGWHSIAELEVDWKHMI